MKSFNEYILEQKLIQNVIENNIDLSAIFDSILKYAEEVGRDKFIEQTTQSPTSTVAAATGTTSTLPAVTNQQQISLNPQQQQNPQLIKQISTNVENLKKSLGLLNIPKQAVEKLLAGVTQVTTPQPVTQIKV